MAGKPPRFWAYQSDKYAREAAPVVRALLTPLSWLYAQGFKMRQARARPEEVAPFVICVGNLTVGGSGKTPLVRYLRTALSAQGTRVATLSRGYNGKLSGPLQVDAKEHSARDVGDEPLMLAQDGESWIGANRYEAANAMAAAGVEVIIMDDGFQNWSLKKDYNILVFDAGDPVGNGHLLPKGPLREPVKAGMARADIAIYMGKNTLNRAYSKWPIDPFLELDIESDYVVGDRPYVAFAGIGRPQKFFDSLAHIGAKICDSISYSDHHSFTKGDLRFLYKLADDYGARLITTEKDWMRLSQTDRDAIDFMRIRLQAHPEMAPWIRDIKAQIASKR